jgi:hypothetical protein
MKMLIMTALALALAFFLGGCGEGFPDEEMHFGIEDKVRPYAVIIEPPEAAPGQTVQVTLLARTPDPDALDISWRAALDFDRGLYEVDEIERGYRPVPAPLPAVDSDGFLTQTFSWTVPDSALLLTSALPAVLDDPTLVLLATELIGPAAGTPPTRTAVDAWLKALTPAALAALTPDEREAVWALADRFACQVRLRAQLRTGRVIDVTRNLTIRHTARLGGPNTNHNAEVLELAVIALAKQDAEDSAIGVADVPQTRYTFIGGGVRETDVQQVPVHADWTYYLEVRFHRESYSSPFDPNVMVTEDGEERWYYYRQDNPTAEHHFFIAEDGTEAEMWNLGRTARIAPAGVGSRFRVVAAVRDTRADWVQYHAAPGAAAQEGIVEFVAP